MANASSANDVCTVTFNVKHKCRMGRAVCVVGNHEDLGRWDVRKALLLNCSKSNEELWTGNKQLSFPADQNQLEFKYILRNSDINDGTDGFPIWEQLDNNGNRELRLKLGLIPCDNSVVFDSDSAGGSPAGHGAGESSAGHGAELNSDVNDTKKNLGNDNVAEKSSAGHDAGVGSNMDNAKTKQKFEEKFLFYEEIRSNPCKTRFRRVQSVWIEYNRSFWDGTVFAVLAIFATIFFNSPEIDVSVVAELFLIFAYLSFIKSNPQMVPNNIQRFHSRAEALVNRSVVVLEIKKVRRMALLAVIKSYFHHEGGRTQTITADILELAILLGNAVCLVIIPCQNGPSLIWSVLLGSFSLLFVNFLIRKVGHSVVYHTFFLNGRYMMGHYFNRTIEEYPQFYMEINDEVEDNFKIAQKNHNTGVSPTMIT